ncbi:MAG TPA: cellulase family glycosylhydrolase [Lacunisphaera sp.]
MSNPTEAVPLPLVTQRAAHLRRGINLSHWYAQAIAPADYTPAHLETYMTDRDLELVAEMGFDHVRFTVNPAPMLNLPADYLARLDRNVEKLLSLGLAVIIDMHPEVNFKKWIATEEGSAAFVTFWGELAAHMAKFDESRTFLEVLNEPEVLDPKRWNTIQNRAITAIRKGAPRHTIIASGDGYSQLPMLELLELPQERNLIANFHLYDPIAFTHQGATWSPPWAMSCQGMTYPSDPAFVREFLKNVDDPEAVREIAAYAEEGWNPARYEVMIARAAEWGRARGLALTCNEFGVYKMFAPRACRLAWLHDVTGLLEKYGIGWTMWDYAGGFAVVRNENGRRQPDVELLQAVRLRA